MNIVVCVKMTPDAEDIEIRSDGSIALDRAEWAIGGFDLQPMEAGVRLTESAPGVTEPGSKVTALSAGPKMINNSKLKKDVLSRGPDELVIIADEALKDADTHITAQVLAAAIRKLGQVDLVLCGEGSADLYFQQVGLQLGELLELPTLNAISKIEKSGSGLLVERSLEDEVELIEIPLPAVLSVTVDIHEARLPTMKEILKASKKPVTEWSLADMGVNAERQVDILAVRAPEQVQRKRVMIEGSAEEAAKALVGYLKRDGVL